MKKSVLIRAALLCLLAVPAAGQVPAGPQEKMPLDGEVRVGRLDNGITTIPGSGRISSSPTT